MARIGLTVFTFAVTAAASSNYPAKVVGVSGGDTPTVVRDGREPVAISFRSPDALGG